MDDAILFNTEQDLAREATLQLKLIDNMAIGIFLASPDRTILRANVWVANVFGYTKEELVGQSVRLIHVNDDNFEEFGHHYRLITGYVKDTVNLEYPFCRRDGTEFMAAISGSLLDPHDPSKGVIWTVQDISEKYVLEGQLRFLAHHDVLTGLPNRTVLENHLRQAMERSRRQKQLLAVGVLDLDNFKTVNDTYGHPAGDELLKTIANRLRAALRTYDLLVRLGGDEFVLVIENVESKDKLLPLLKRLQEAVEAPVQLKYQQSEVVVNVGASLGLVLYPEITGEPDFLIREADQVLYQIKSLKDRRKRWWAIGYDKDQDVPDIANLPPYGKGAMEVLTPVMPQLQKIKNEWIILCENFIIESSKFKDVIKIMEYSQYWEWALSHDLHLSKLFDPHLTEKEHRAFAEKFGRGLEIAGIDWSKVFDLYNRWMIHLEESARRYHFSPEVVHILLQRLWKDAEGQAEGYHKIDVQRLQVLTDIDALVWEINDWNTLADRLTQHLIKLVEVTSVAIAQPNLEGKFLFEHIEGDFMVAYVKALAAGLAQPVCNYPDVPEGIGPIGRAWRYGSIQRSINLVTDDSVQAWRSFCLEHRVLSIVAVPLLTQDGRPHAVLAMYSPYFGGMSSSSQQSLIEHLQKIIGLRLESMKRHEQCAPVLTNHDQYMSISTWEHRLIMHYQPIIDLKVGRIAKVEALARLQNDDGTLQRPADFLPFLTTDGLKTLFKLGLEQCFQALRQWQGKGDEYDLTLNLPPINHIDNRYLDILEYALEQFDVMPHQLMLEVLQSDSTEDMHPLYALLQTFNQMGIYLAEDDLATGYGSLLRKSRFPINMIKINQNLIQELIHDPIRMITVVYNLINTAQMLGLQVIVEGLETPSHVEMAAILGADFGQGFGIAKPMKAEELASFAKSFNWNTGICQTALGALTGYWKKVMDANIVFHHYHSLMPIFADGECVLADYIQYKSLHGTKLEGLHHRIHETYRDGNMERFTETQHQLVDLLIERMREELSLVLQ